MPQEPLTPTPSIYNIPAGVGFLPALVRGVLNLVGGRIEALPTVRIYLPTRRACREAQIAFLREFEGRPALMPRLQPLGDTDEDDIAMRLAGLGESISKSDLDIPPPMPGLHRVLILAKLIGQSDLSMNADTAMRLAEELGRLMDHIHVQGLDMSDLPGLVDGAELSEHWQLTLEFLTILSQNWPEILASYNRIDTADARNRITRLLAKWYRDSQSTDITIAAGSSGSIPATADLLAAIAGLPNGHVILPGLSTHMDEKSWEVLTPSHPQYALKNLLNMMGVERKEVGIWASQESADPARLWLAEEMMRPADTLEKWADLELPRTTSLNDVRESLADMSLTVCESPEQEAQTIALALREIVEQDGKTATLVTSDRNLARRVCAVCARWGIDLDDSAGAPLPQTRVGSFLLLTAQACHEGLAPLAMLAMLKHPLANCAMDGQIFRQKIRQLEKQALRGPAPESFDSLCRDMADRDLDLADLLGAIQKAMAPFMDLVGQGKEHDFQEFLKAHIQICESLAGGADYLWRGEDGEGAALLLAELSETAQTLGPGFPGQISSREYLGIIRQFMGRKTVRPKYGVHPRLSILGRLEARLIHADLVIMAGLNEGSWPPEPENDPWMSRPMRANFGLPSPDEGIGKSAHDFVQLFCQKRVLMTRSARVDGTPTVPARWLQRLSAVLKSLTPPNKTEKESGLRIEPGPYLDWAEQLDQTGSIPIVAPRPRPSPPVAVRPREMGVTSIEKWMRDPYHIYAEKILKLRKLDPIEKDAEAAEFGNWIHAALHEFVQKYPQDLPLDASDILREIGRRHLGSQLKKPNIRDFWWPRFENIITGYLEHEREWRGRATALPKALESSGAWEVPAPAGPFRITAKADRIDQMHDGRYAIIDYKTGTIPQAGHIVRGFAPQLSLEALTVEKGGFEALIPRPVSLLSYWKLSGRKDTADIKYYGDSKRYRIEDILPNAEEGVQKLIAVFDLPQTAYISLPRAKYGIRQEYQDYAHLARVKEWSAGPQDGDGDGDE